MKNQQSGFTLIELIMVIVILGILAAVAIPRFIDLSGEARDAAAQGVAGAIAAAGAINYAACVADHGDCVTITVDAACSGLPWNNLLAGGLPANFTVGGEVPACTVEHDDGSATAAAPVPATP